MSHVLTKRAWGAAGGDWICAFLRIVSNTLLYGALPSSLSTPIQLYGLFTDSLIHSALPSPASCDSDIQDKRPLWPLLRRESNESKIIVYIFALR